MLTPHTESYQSVNALDEVGNRRQAIRPILLRLDQDTPEALSVATPLNRRL